MPGIYPQMVEVLEAEMMDITMCLNHKCATKKECYRYMAFPNIHGQSYAKFGKKRGDKVCRDIYPMRTKI